MDGTDKNTLALLALQYVEDATPRKRDILTTAFKTPAEMCEPGARNTVEKILGAENAANFYKNLDEYEKIINNMKARGIHWITSLDAEYPERLKETDGYPHVLFALGDVKLLNLPCIATVGTRRPTRYGLKATESFVRDFINEGLIVVSGFARGIDAAAHKTCVDNGAPTIAVFACGLDTVYPAEHKGLAEAVLKSGGLIVSEYGLGVKPLQYRFPERNRIISGLSAGVFLPEAAKKSGSLITVNLAIEQGRELFILPGNIYSEESSGCNAQLRETPDAMIISSDDVFERLNIKRGRSLPQPVQLSLDETLITEALHDGELHFEELLDITGLQTAELNSILINMEINGIVIRSAGNYYSLY